MVFSLLELSCGNPGTTPGGIFQSPSGTGYVFIGDAPPPGTSILKFEITLSSATLCPQVGSGGECLGSPQVELISDPVTIEWKQLELESAFLALKTVAVGSYAGVRLTFSNPELKVLNTDGSVDELKGPEELPLSPTSVTPLFPNGLTVGADTNFSFLIDFNVNDSIQSSGTAITGIAPAVSLVGLPITTEQPIQELDDTSGIVSNLNESCPTGSFTLTDSMTGVAIAVRFDDTTELEDDLTCETLAERQKVEADIELQSSSPQSAQFFAKEIKLVYPPEEQSLVGQVFQVNPFDEANNRYRFVLLVQNDEDVSGIADGAMVTVSFDPDRVVLKLDSGDLPAEASAFASGTDLLAGQTVEVNVLSGSVKVGTNDCAAIDDGCVASTEEIRLKKGTLTARVAGTSQPEFTLTKLPSLFGGLDIFRPLSTDCQTCAVGTITVVTSDATAYGEGLSGFTSLQVGNFVVVRGLLLKDGFQGPPPGNGSPRLIAEKIQRVTP